jgi:Asp-tRNA(Asn)/Glu-tRNA(Gln) amidotransferase A subunit family amidase
MARSTENHLQPFAGASAAFLDGSDTPRAFLDRCHETIAARDGEIEAFAVLNAAPARDAADASGKRFRDGRPLSALDGCPVAVKDIIDTVDLPTEMNAEARKGNRPPRDAACVRALRQSGAIVIGKTVTTEFACGRSGPTRNPYDVARTPGGSSSGSGAAVGAGMVPVALGTQTAGSVLRPASYCGAYAIKPSLGAINLGGVHPVSGTRDHLGVIAASLADAWQTAHFMSAHAGPAAGYEAMAGGSTLPDALKPVRLGFLHLAGWQEIDDATRTAFETLLGRLRAAGVDVVDPGGDPSLANVDRMAVAVAAPGRDIMSYEMLWPYLAYQEAGLTLSTPIQDYLAHGRSVTAAAYQSALQARHDTRARVAANEANVDAFISLSASGPAPVGLEYTGSRAFQTPWTVLGLPSLSLPLLSVDGLPVGVQLLGFDHGEERLAATARWIDELEMAA